MYPNPKVSLESGSMIEMVKIPEKKRLTLCISSQVGCTLNCRFCHTGTQRLVKNLSFTEIVNQVMIAKEQINDWDEQKKITNFVDTIFGDYRNILKNYDFKCNIVLCNIYVPYNKKNSVYLKALMSLSPLTGIAEKTEDLVDDIDEDSTNLKKIN